MRADTRTVAAVRDMLEEYAGALSRGDLDTVMAMFAKDPDLVKRMTSAFLKGLADTIANPDEAYNISKKYVPNLSTLDEKVQKEVLSRSIELWKTSHLGLSDPQAWQNMQQTLLKMGMLKQPLDVSKAFTNQFVP